MPKSAERPCAALTGPITPSRTAFLDDLADVNGDSAALPATGPRLGAVTAEPVLPAITGRGGRNCRARRASRAVLAGRGTAFVAAVLFAGGLPAQPAATPLQSHRAVYSMSLASTPNRSEVVSADGRMLYRFARSCDGWTVENRTVLRLGYEDDRDVDTVWTFASWESLDGLNFSFHARYEQDGQTIERLDGEARLDGPGKGGRVEFTRPEERTVELPPGTVFPTQHVRLLIDAAERGNKTLAKVVFDGASIDNPYFVNGVFGPLKTADAERLAKAAGLPVLPSWWTRMAFFPVDNDEPVPEFEISADYRSDGIADNVVQYFREFALRLRLRELSSIPPPEC